MISKDEFISVFGQKDAGSMIYEMFAKHEQRIHELEEEVAHLKGQMTDDDVEHAILQGLDKEVDLAEAR